MEIAITLEIDAGAYAKSDEIRSLSDKMNEFVKDKDYAASIQYYYFGCICIKEKPGYEDWYKLRKPRFVENDSVKLPDGTIEQLGVTYSYDIKPDYEYYVSVDGEESWNYLVGMVKESFANLERLSRKAKDFDKVRFRKEMEEFLDGLMSSGTPDVIF